MHSSKASAAVQSATLPSVNKKRQRPAVAIRQGMDLGLSSAARETDPKKNPAPQNQRQRCYAGGKRFMMFRAVSFGALSAYDSASETYEAKSGVSM